MEYGRGMKKTLTIIVLGMGLLTGAVSLTTYQEKKVAPVVGDPNVPPPGCPPFCEGR